MTAPEASARSVRTRVARPVADEIEAMDPPSRQALAQHVVDISDAVGEPIDIPGAPPGTSYLAFVPPEPNLPVIVYRPMRPDEDGDWLVTALLDRETYTQQRIAEVGGLLSNPAVRAGIQAAAITAAGIAIGMVAGRNATGNTSR
jgi:hypothetical protein